MDTKMVVTTVAMRIEAAIIFSGKSVKEIAAEAGVRPNVISMIKKGAIRVPLERIPAIADALEIERWQLAYLCWSEYHPEIYASLEACFPGINLSPADVDWLSSARQFIINLRSQKQRATTTRRRPKDSLSFAVSAASFQKPARLPLPIDAKP